MSETSRQLIQSIEPEESVGSGASLYLPYSVDKELDALTSIEMLSYSFGRSVGLPSPGTVDLRWVNGVPLSTSYGMPVWHDCIMVAVSANSDDNIIFGGSEGNVLLYKNGSLEATYTDIFNGAVTTAVRFSVGDEVFLQATVTSGQNGISGPLVRTYFRREQT